MSSSYTRKTPPEVEKVIEGRFIKICKKRGWKHRKLNGVGNRSWPDQLVMASEGVLALIEFKRVGGKPDPLQESFIEDAEFLGHDVLVTCSEHAAEEYINKKIEEALNKRRQHK